MGEVPLGSSTALTKLKQTAYTANAKFLMKLSVRFKRIQFLLQPGTE